MKNQNGKLVWRILVNLSSIYLLVLFGMYGYTFVQEGGRFIIDSVSIEGFTLFFEMVAIVILLLEFPAKRLAHQVQMFFKKNRQENQKATNKQTVKKAVNK